MRIDILFLPGCPNVHRAHDRLRQALRATAVVASVRQIEVATREAAERCGMSGSPTLLLDGRDPFVEDRASGSLSCRLYRTGAHFEGAPSVAQLIEALGGFPVGGRE